MIGLHIMHSGAPTGLKCEVILVLYFINLWSKANVCLGRAFRAHRCIGETERDSITEREEEKNTKHRSKQMRLCWFPNGTEITTFVLLCKMSLQAIDEWYHWMRSSIRSINFVDHLMSSEYVWYMVTARESLLLIIETTQDILQRLTVLIIRLFEAMHLLFINKVRRVRMQHHGNRHNHMPRC